MQSTNDRTMYIILGAAVLVIFIGIIILVASRSSANNRPTPTISVDAIYTAAYQTIAVEQTAQQASNPPTTTPVPSLTEMTEVTSPIPMNTLVLASSTSGVAQGCDNSLYISDVTIPDHTIMNPGQAFTKTWAVQNTGTCAWNTSYKLGFAFGTAMNGTTTAIPQSVAPGAQTQISVSLVAPSSLGNYTGNWKLQNDQGQYFGTFLTVVINVVPGTATATTTGSTLAATFTNTPTSSPTSTNVAANTNTPTSTATPTATTSP
jgi:hypothetical protein